MNFFLYMSYAFFTINTIWLILVAVDLNDL